MNYLLYFRVQQFVRKLPGKFVKPAVIVKAGTNYTNIDFKAPENQVSGMFAIYNKSTFRKVFL